MILEKERADTNEAAGSFPQTLLKALNGLPTEPFRRPIIKIYETWFAYERSHKTLSDQRQKQETLGQVEMSEELDKYLKEAVILPNHTVLSRGRLIVVTATRDAERGPQPGLSIQELRRDYPPVKVEGTEFTTETLWEEVKNRVAKMRSIRDNSPQNIAFQNSALLSQYGELANIVGVNTKDTRALKDLDLFISKALTETLGRRILCRYIALSEVT